MNTALVTGGARGIGKACALALAARGLDVALVDVLADEIEITASAIRALGRRVLPYRGDVASFARAAEVVADVHAAWGRIDVLVNVAGRSMPAGITTITEDEWDQTIDVNLKSCFNYIHAVAPIMLAQGGGRIISTSSVSALSGGVTRAVSKFAYAAAKAGILGMTRALAKELGPSIAVNAICPGVIETELVKGMVASRTQELVEGIALGRLGTPEDVAGLVAFLATTEPNFITGQAFVVDGCQWIT
jgi:3-oxoacyl-[acyl-carrier protein] reductase